MSRRPLPLPLLLRRLPDLQLSAPPLPPEPAPLRCPHCSLPPPIAAAFCALRLFCPFHCSTHIVFPHFRPLNFSREIFEFDAHDQRDRKALELAWSV